MRNVLLILHDLFFLIGQLFVMSCDRVQDERHFRNVFVGLLVEDFRVVVSETSRRFVKSCVMSVLINGLSQELESSSCHFNHRSHVGYVR